METKVIIVELAGTQLQFTLGEYNDPNQPELLY